MGLTSLSPMIIMTITTEISDMQYRSYITGDQIWVRTTAGCEEVVKVITHDGKYWEEGMPNLVNLSGFERFIHRVHVFALQILHRI